MNRLIEPEIVQNDAIAAVVLWAFVNEYCTLKPEGVSLLWLVPILPIVFHNDTVESIYNRNYDGGMLLALAQDRTLVSGLQGRMESMTAQTLSALNVALAAKLIEIDESGRNVVSLRRTPPFTYGLNIKPLIATAERLGYWFGSSSDDMIASSLRIRF